MINGYIIKCGINKKEDFFSLFSESGQGKPLRTKCYYLYCVSISFLLIRKK